MKKTMALFLALVMVFAFVGCSNEKEDVKSEGV